MVILIIKLIFKYLKKVLPVIKNGSRAEIVNASMKRSHLWPLFQTFTLQENMRVLKYGKSNELKEFDEWLLGELYTEI